ncbi:fusion protein [Dysgonomonas sp. ZJ709]|uniref:fusion protein n=1 Tax=Dysgonomonas sp. ZJ709 TaxID=2709797 RepID=UPI0013EAE306|nr:fusion protein [Dysgonomonas sp. ZJ709]
MNKVYLLASRQTIDKDQQAVAINQIIRMEGYSYDKYVVYDITQDRWGVHYHLINLRTFHFDTSEIIRPLSQKFGIGMYFDEHNIVFKTDEEVAEILAKAKEQEAKEQEEEQREKERVEAVKVIGRQWLKDNLPMDAKAIIVAHLKQDESDSQTDYFASSTARTVILGFSKHKRDIFSEMRKCASNFEETAYLAEYNEEYEHREKYSMGAGYYLGESSYHGWIIEKETFSDCERAIEYFAYIAGSADNIHIKTTSVKAFKTEPKEQTKTQISNEKLQFEIVDYSQKAIALFGDTKAIKDLLLAMGGKFNPRLTHNEQKQAGWIFSKSKRNELNTILNLKA